MKRALVYFTIRIQKYVHGHDNLIHLRISVQLNAMKTLTTYKINQKLNNYCLLYAVTFVFTLKKRFQPLEVFDSRKSETHATRFLCLRNYSNRRVQRVLRSLYMAYDGWKKSKQPKVTLMQFVCIDGISCVQFTFTKLTENDVANVR